MAKTITDTGFQHIRPVTEVIDNATEEAIAGYGAVDMVSGLEAQPCYMCKSFDDVGPERLIEYIIHKGFRPRPDGKFESPIQDDFKNEKRANLTIDPKGCGMCKRTPGMVIEGLATCEAWSPVKTISEFQQRMIRRRR